MKLTYLFRLSSFGRLVSPGMVWPVLPAVLCLAWLAGAADTNQPTSEIVIPKSVFVNDPRGKDPFFPNRQRFGVSTTTVTNVVSKSGPNLNDLQLRGITGTPERRVALINGQPLVKGEEWEFRISTGKLKIRVLEIGERSVKVSIEGQAEPRELLLPERQLPIAPTEP